MARGVRVSIQEKIEKQQEKVNRAKERLEAEEAVLKDLEAKADEEKESEILDAIKSSGKSLDEIMEMIKG